MGPAYRVVAGLCVSISLGIFYVGVQPPNGQALIVLLAIFAITGALWLLSERRRFKGPPLGREIARRRADIASAELAFAAAADLGPETPPLG